jgi:outer membrane protein TolC
MEKNMKKIFFIKLLFIYTLYANSLSLQDSIDKTLLNHPDIKIFMLNIEQAKEASKIASSDYLPQINFKGEYDFVQTNLLPPSSGSTDRGWSAGISATRKIWDFSKTSSKIKAAKIEEEISKLSLEDAKSLLVYKVKSLYAFLLVQKEAITVRKKDLKIKEAYYAQANALVEQGLKTDADASRFLSSVYVAKDNLVVAKASYAKTKTTLALYMGEELNDDTVLDKTVIKRELFSSEHIKIEILEHNYKTKIDSQSIAKNKHLQQSEKASHYGSIDALASYNRVDSFLSYDSKLVGVTLSIPIYSGGRMSAEVQKAKIAVQLAYEQKASSLLVLKEEIDTLLIDIRRYTQTIETKKAGLNSDNKTKRVLEARYKEGLATYIEVLDASSSVLNSNLAVIEAYYFRTIAINRLQYLKGDLS